MLRQLVRHLDGIPLAIELAAARTNLLSPAQILSRLHQTRLDLLQRPGGSRHGSLRQAIAWSWELLTATEQRGLARCAVFPGWFSVDAGSCVTDQEDALECLQALRDKSLLVRCLEDDGTASLAMLGTVREFALERAHELGELDEARARHRAWYRALADRLAEQEKRAVPQQLQQNLDVLLELGPEHADTVAAAAVVLHRTRPRAEAVKMLQSALDLGPPSPLRERLLYFLIGSLYHCGRQHEARALVPGLHDLGTPEAELAASLRVAQIHLAEGGVVSPEVAWRTERMARRLAEPVYLRAAPLVVVKSLWSSDRREEAMDAIERFLTEQGEAPSLDLLALRASFVADRGDVELALRHLEQLAEAASQRGDVFQGIRVSVDRVELLLGQGRLEEARELAQATLPEVKRVSVSHEIILHLLLGLIQHLGGRLVQALEQFERARALAVSARSKWLSWAWLEIAAVQSDRGHIELAEEALRKGEVGEPGFHATKLEAYGALVAGHLDVARARLSGDRERLAAAERQARQRLAKAESSPLRFTELQVGIRRLRGVLERASPLAVEPERVLRVGPEARWFAVGDLGVVQLERRRAMRRILAGLVEQRLGHDAALSSEEVFDLGWPGERILPQAATHRVYVAVASLRQMGLKDVLVTDDDGYRLSRAWDVRCEEADSTKTQTAIATA